jgi:hypothetical protein
VVCGRQIIKVRKSGVCRRSNIKVRRNPVWWTFEKLNFSMHLKGPQNQNFTILSSADSAVAGKLGRFQEETFSQIEIFLSGRDMKTVHLNVSGTNSRKHFY